MDVNPGAITLINDSAPFYAKLKKGLIAGVVTGTLTFFIITFIALVSTGKPFRRNNRLGKDELDKRKYFIIAGSSAMLILVATTLFICR